MLDRIADGRTDLVFDFLTAGNAADTKDPKGVSLLQWCAYYGDVSAMRHLLDHGESLASLGENFDLNGAAFHGHWRLTQFLIESGADVNVARADNGETALHAALSKAGRPSTQHVVEVLLASGASPNAATKPSAETGAFMRDCRTKGETPLHRAAAFASAQTIRRLLGAGAAVDARDMNGDSPLSWASWHLRPARILQMLCFGEFRIHPDLIERSTGDHGFGPSGMDVHLLGRP